jgi:hypothetical protein
VSIYGINVPAPDAHDYHAADLEERRRRTLQSLDVGDVIASVEDALASEADPQRHPLFPVANWLLDRQGRVDGGAFWLQWQVLVDQAIERLVEARLQGED